MQRDDFPRVLAAESVSNFGSMLSRLAIPFLAALQLQATPAQMAALLVADVVAGAVGSLWLGGLIDRHGKRTAMLLADGLRCALLAALALAAWAGVVSMLLLVLVSATSGLLTVAFELARSAWTAQRVADADLPRRNAQLSVAGSLSETAAFAIGGWLYQGLGAALSLAVDALSYALSALCLRSVAEVPAVSAEPRPAKSARQALRQGMWHKLWQDLSQDLSQNLSQNLAAGLRAVADRPLLRALVAVEALLKFSMALTGTVYMIYVTRDVALPTGPMGMVAAMGALGAVAGASLAPRLGRTLGPGWTMTLGLLAFAIGAACVPMAPAANAANAASAASAASATQGLGWAAVAWLLAHQVVGDAGHVMHDVHDRTLRQTAVPDALLARVDAGIRSAGQLALLAGAVAGGVIGSATDARTVLWLAAVIAALAAGLAALRLSPYRLTDPG